MFPFLFLFSLGFFCGFILFLFCVLFFIFLLFFLPLLYFVFCFFLFSFLGFFFVCVCVFIGGGGVLKVNK